MFASCKMSQCLALYHHMPEVHAVLEQIETQPSLLNKHSRL